MEHTIPSSERDVEVLVGGFGPLNDEHSKGIEHYRLSADSRRSAGVALRHVGLSIELPSPTWLVRDGRCIYAVLENTSEIATLRLEETVDGLRLVECGRQPVRGSGPTHAIVARDDRGHRHILAANYADGSISVHPLDDQGMVLEATELLQGSGGGPLPAQEGPHAHWLLQIPDGRVLSTDLGADRIHVHQWQDGVLHRVDSVRLTPGTGPRDMHVLPAVADACRVAVVDEWGDTVTLLDGDGDVRVMQTVDLGGDDADQAASLAYVPVSACAGGSPSDEDGVLGFAYVGLRGSDRIVTLAWDGTSLRRLDHPWIDGWRGRGVSCGGGRPRQLVALGGLVLVADETSDNLAVFQIGSDGEPRQVAAVAAPSPTVLLPL